LCEYYIDSPLHGLANMHLLFVGLIGKNVLSYHMRHEFLNIEIKRDTRYAKKRGGWASKY